MLGRILKRLVGTYRMRELARAESLLQRIERAGKNLSARSDNELVECAQRLRSRAQSGEPLDRMLPDCYALVREVASRTLGLRLFDVQLLGGIALHRGNLVEMKTGEGKTLVATLPVALSALTGRGVHVITVNDYLAERDALWMGPVYGFLGLTVGVVKEDIDPDSQGHLRRAAYAADVTYVTNSELVFDYLRDHLATDPGEAVLRPLNHAVVDEVDLLLLDEAQTPLIISGPTGDSPDYCQRAREVAADLREKRHYQVDHKNRQVLLQEAGYRVVERALGIANIAAPEQLPWQHAIHNAMLAHAIYKRDVDYIVADDRVFLVDDFTGRVSPDKRFADGLHQALEAKEQVTIRSEDRTLAKVSYQTFFRLYPRLCGMSGTVYSAREEFQSTYGLRVVVIPTHRPMIRRDSPPVVYRTEAEKFQAVLAEIGSIRVRGGPVLVGTTSVGESEELSRLLGEQGVPHQVLNAKQNSQEAAIIAQAGRSATVTISTNMAGRGVDILLGGNPDFPGASWGREECGRDRQRVIEAGGLSVIGTGLHESQRIDDQLRGRAGRQGDPGRSLYFISLDDPVYRKFGQIIRGAQVLAELRSCLTRHPSGEPVRDRFVCRSLEDLRRKVEVENQSIRREVLRYDLVIDDQRRTIYAWRRRLLFAEPGQDRELHAVLGEMLSSLPADLLNLELPPDELASEIHERFGIDPGGEEATVQPLVDRALEEARKRITGLESSMGSARFDELLRDVLLACIDDLWIDHLGALERVDEGIGLRSYAQLDPLIEFRKEAKNLYDELTQAIRLETIGAILAEEESFRNNKIRGSRHPFRW